MAAEIRLPAFVRLDPHAGWRLAAAASDGVEIDPRTGAVQLGFVGRRGSPLTDPSGAFGGLTLPTGVAVAPGGAVLVASPDAGEILHAPNPALFPDGGADVPGFAPLWPAVARDQAAVPADQCALAAAAPPARGPYDLVRPRGLAFSRDGDLVVADEGDAATPGRLLFYTWPRMAVRHVLHVDGRPWDVAVDSAGRIHVADPAAGRVRRFDRLWREDGWPGGAGTLRRPRHLVIDADDTVFAIDEDPATGAGRLSRLGPLGEARPLDQAEATAFWRRRYPTPIRAEGGSLFAPGVSCPEHGPLLRNVSLDRRGRLPQGPVLLYREQQGRRARRGRFVTEALDSDRFNFAWHMLRFDMDLAAADAVEIQSYTAAQALEPERVAHLPEQSWSRRLVLTPGSRHEALLQSPPGRFLWLRIGLVGDGLSTPRLRAVEILGPRRSSLRFLPAPFHEDAVSRDFLDRFLSYFDTVFAELEQRIGGFAAQLTPRGAPEGAFLAWLASWFDIEFLAEWPDATRRAFVAQAMDLHRMRGTVAGLSAVLRLHLGLEPPMPVVIEGFRLRAYAARRAAVTGADLPDGLLRLGGVPLPLAEGDVAHRFLLVLPQASVPTETDRETLKRLVDRFRPAHTSWSLVAVGPGIRVGCQSTVGVDTLVGGYPAAPLGEMRLGQSARLRPPPNNLPRVGQAVLRASAAM